jgi:hypothetical protein
VPKKFVFKCFELLEPNSDSNFKPILDYFEKYYLGEKISPTSNSRKKPFYQVNVWNLYERVLCHAARSNNQIEA